MLLGFEHFLSSVFGPGRSKPFGAIGNPECQHGLNHRVIDQCVVSSGEMFCKSKCDGEKYLDCTYIACTKFSLDHDWAPLVTSRE